MKRMLASHRLNWLLLLLDSHHRPVARGGSVGANEPPSQIKGPKKRSTILKKRSTISKKRSTMLKKRSTIFKERSTIFKENFHYFTIKRSTILNMSIIKVH